MGKRITEKILKGHENSLINLDPKGELLYGCSDLMICKSCLKLYGRVVRKIDKSQDPQSEWYFMNCNCKNKEVEKNGTVNPEKAVSEIKTSIEFCQCCSMELINFGTNFARFL